MLLSSGTNPYVEHGSLVPDVVHFNHGKDINLLHVKFATPAYVIRRCERSFYEWTDVDISEPSQECSLVSDTFLLGHPVYIYIYIYIYTHTHTHTHTHTQTLIGFFH